MFPSRFRAISDSGSRLRVPTQRCRQYLCAKGVSVDIPECSSETGVGPCRTCRFLFLLPVRRPPSCPCCVAESWRSWCASTRRGLAWTPGLVGAGNHNHDYARPTSNRLPWHARWTGSEALRARERIDGRPRHQRFVSIPLRGCGGRPWNITLASTGVGRQWMSHKDPKMSCSTRMRTVVAFFRAGYPAGITPPGHIALLALCPARPPYGNR